MSSRHLTSCLVIDLEVSNGGVLELGVGVVDFRSRSLERFGSWLIRLSEPIDPDVAGLTGITDELVRGEGRRLEDVWNTVRREYSRDLPWGAWGKDGQLVARESSVRGIAPPFGDTYFDFGRLYGMTRAAGERVGLDEAMVAHGLEFEGRRHRARDDAYNLGRLILEAFRFPTWPAPGAAPRTATSSTGTR